MKKAGFYRSFRSVVRDVHAVAGRALSVTITIAALTWAPFTQAAPVTLVGDTVSYQYDDSQAAIGLFGVPVISGDVIRFLPATFRAQSLNGDGADLMSSTFLFDRVYTNSGADIAGIRTVEEGDYRIIGDGFVSADLSLRASNNNDFTESVSDSDSISASGTSGFQEFSLSAGFNVAESFESPANDIALAIGNDLLAITDANGEVAWVQKKLSFTAVSQVPIPAAAGLFMSALMGLLLVGRRKARVAAAATA